jgi:oxygen-independent coproporphyrinogen-3 oxidase
MTSLGGDDPLESVVPTTASPRAAYFHVPFCAHRCGYCDFTLISGRDDLIGDYLRSIRREVEAANIRLKSPLDTIFLGGGTPTHLSPSELRLLFQLIQEQFHCTSDTEFSVEANPLDLTDEKIRVLGESGINRVSLGVQSFSPQALKILERDHQPEQVDDVMSRLRTSFENVSIDLIFGVPGQNLADWRETLLRAIDRNPSHISTYGLTFEKGTAFWTRRERGEFTGVDEELERDQYALAMELLPASGFSQYEISNFARPGFECRHNNVYWNGDEYWAFGPGAARYINGRRETNIRSVLGWLARIERGESPVADSEELDATHRARELIYLGLRRTQGISRDWFARRTGVELDALCGSALSEQCRRGFIEDNGIRVCLTTEGRFVADRVVMEFL